MVYLSELVQINSCNRHFLFWAILALYILSEILIFIFNDRHYLKYIAFVIFGIIFSVIPLLSDGCKHCTTIFIIGCVVAFFSLVYFFRNIIFRFLDNAEYKLKDNKKKKISLYNFILTIHNFIDDSYSLAEAINKTVDDGIRINLTKFEIDKKLNSSFLGLLKFKRHKISIGNSNIILPDIIYYKHETKKKVKYKKIAYIYETKNHKLMVCFKKSSLLKNQFKTYNMVELLRWPLNGKYHLIIIEKSFTQEKVLSLCEKLVENSISQIKERS